MSLFDPLYKPCTGEIMILCIYIGQLPTPRLNRYSKTEKSIQLKMKVNFPLTETKKGSKLSFTYMKSRFEASTNGSNLHRQLAPKIAFFAKPYTILGIYFTLEQS